MTDKQQTPFTQYPVFPRTVCSTNDVLVAYFFALFFVCFIWLIMCMGIHFHPILQVFILGISFAVVESKRFSGSKKSSVHLTGKGIELIDNGKTKLKLPWDWLTKFEIREKSGSLFPNYVYLKFKDDSDSLILLDDISDDLDATTMISCVQTWAPHAEIVCNAQVAKSESIATYTELWLKDLSSSNTPRRLNVRQMLAQGTILSNCYQIENVLSGGGQGTVYLASVVQAADVPNLPPSVVVKEYILPSNESGMKKAIDSLRREVSMLQQIKHPDVILLYDFFIEDMRAYFVLEYIHGSTLRDIVEANGPLNEKKVVFIGIRLCEILCYLQGLTPSVIHGDVTPDNLMLMPDGNIKLMDFDASAELTRNKTNTVVGKHAYMSSEQFKGEISESNDQYALGCTLNFLLTGIDPEPMTESQPKNTNKQVSSQLNEIVRRATKFDKNQRFPNLHAMRHSLEQI